MLASARAEHARARARDELSRALEMFERSMDAEHLAVATTATNLGLAYLSLGDASAALEQFERASELNRERDIDAWLREHQVSSDP